MSQVIAERRLPSGAILRLVVGDLTEEAAEVIVNAANASLAHGGGVAGAIARRGGPEIQRESDDWVRRHGTVSHERPAITGAGRLRARWVVHAVGPVWGEGEEDAKLASAVKGALSVANEQGVASVALPAISTGIFGFPVDRAAGVILSSIVEFDRAHPASSVRDIRVVLHDERSGDAFSRALSARIPDGAR